MLRLFVAEAPQVFGHGGHLQGTQVSRKAGDCGLAKFSEARRAAQGAWVPEPATPSTIATTPLLDAFAFDAFALLLPANVNENVSVRVPAWAMEAGATLSIAIQQRSVLPECAQEEAPVLNWRG